MQNSSLANVVVFSPADKDLIVYNSATGKFTNSQANLALTTQPNPAAPISFKVGLQQSIDTKGIVTNFCSLDNSNFGQTSPGSTSYVGFFPQDQSIPNNSDTTVLQNAVTDVQYWNQVPSWCNTGTGIWTVPSTGWYMLNFGGNFTGAGGTVRRLSIVATTSNPSATNFTLKTVSYLSAAAIPSTQTLDMSLFYRFTAGDTFRFVAFQNSGVTINDCLFTMGVYFVSNSFP